MGVGGGRSGSSALLTMAGVAVSSRSARSGPLQDQPKHSCSSTARRRPSATSLWRSESQREMELARAISAVITGDQM